MNKEIEDLCSNLDFDPDYARKLLKTTNVNEEFLDSKYGMASTLLSLAAFYANLPFVEVLLECGADPNLIFDDGQDNVLWDLQYGEDDEAINQTRLKITELLLQHGADPHLELEKEDLLIYAIQMQIEGLVEEDNNAWKHREQFIELLEKYDK